MKDDRRCAWTPRRPSLTEETMDHVMKMLKATSGVLTWVAPGDRRRDRERNPRQQDVLEQGTQTRRGPKR